jgi:hypothetical protein
MDGDAIYKGMQRILYVKGYHQYKILVKALSILQLRYILLYITILLKYLSKSTIKIMKT